MWARMVADIGAVLPGYTLPLLDQLPFRTVIALYQQAGRLRVSRMRDQALMAGQAEIAEMMGGMS